MKEKKKKIIIAASVIVLLIIVVCIALNHDKNSDKDGKEDPPVVDDSAVDTEEELSEKIKKDYELGEFDSSLIGYLQSNGYYYSNFVISPASFRAALCLAAKGAEGNTRTELAVAAGFTDMTELEQWYMDHQNSLYLSRSAMDKNGVSSGSLSAYNSVWEDTEQISDFTHSYRTFIDEQPFADAYACSTEAFAGELDSWVSDKTEGAVPSIERDVTGAASVLVSLMNMQGFMQGEVSQGTFTDINGNKTTLEFIEQTGEFLYADKNGTEILVIPMAGEMSMVLFLGNRTDMYEGLSELDRETVRVTMPRLELSSTFDAGDLLNFLLERGVIEAIDSSTANFMDMCENSDWFLQEVIQRADISVSESPFMEDMENDPSSMNDADIKEFMVDSPFSFAVFSDLGKDGHQVMLYGQLMTVAE